MNNETTSVHLIFLGAPGAGKGTQSKRIAEHYEASHISTGDILRAAVAEGTELGKLAKSYLDNGSLVPDHVIIGLIRERISSPGFPANWIMDGFPRTLAQAEALDELLKEEHLQLNVVLNIDVPLDLLMDRLTERRSCRKTGKIFNLKFNPPENAEDYDLYQRSDDTPEAVGNRLNVYKEQTEPLIQYYRQQNKLVDINGNQEVTQVTSAIIDAVNKSSL